MNYLSVCLCVKHTLVKIAVQNEVFKRVTHFEADDLGCMQPPSSKGGETLQNFTFSHSAAYLEGGLERNGQPFGTRPRVVILLVATRDSGLPISVGMCPEYCKFLGDTRFS